MTNKKNQFFHFQYLFDGIASRKISTLTKKTRNFTKSWYFDENASFHDNTCSVYLQKIVKMKKTENFYLSLIIIMGWKPHFWWQFRQPIYTIPLTQSFSFGPNRKFPKIQGNPWKSMKINENQPKSMKINKNVTFFH